MKKSIIILGMLGFSLSYAQQDNNGKVGVNTETPSATLNVKSKAGISNRTKNLELENASGTKLVTVLDGGRVGIGTDTPTDRLDVRGGIKSMIDANVGGYIDLANMSKTVENSVYRWRIYNMGDIREEVDKYVRGMHFWTYGVDAQGNSLNLGSKMVLTDDGNLGIGFASRIGESVQTNEKLEVNGNIKAKNGIFTKLRVYADDAAADADTNLPSGSLYKLKNTGRQVFVKP